MAKLTSYQADIRPLFTERDIKGMIKAFNLASYDDVKKNAAAIYDRIRGIGGALMPPRPPVGEVPGRNLTSIYSQSGCRTGTNRSRLTSARHTLTRHSFTRRTWTVSRKFRTSLRCVYASDSIAAWLNVFCYCHGKGRGTGDGKIRESYSTSSSALYRSAFAFSRSSGCC
jgi:hypothetical protein